jgi:tRNA threonylcarbamoyladenosine biosynthesis protein TsaB
MEPERRILAVDTATRSCSVAVRVGERLAAEMAVVSDRTHCVHLMRMIRETLHLANLTLAALDGLAVSIGPGSFTGLRIGISTVQGLALAGGKACVGVSSLEALAAACLPGSLKIWALMDARQGEVYAGHYRERAGSLERLAPERVLPLEAVLRAIDSPHLFVGDGALRHQARIREILGDLAGFAMPEQHFPRAATLARLAQPRLEGQPTFDPGLLGARYLRQSDAELRLNTPSVDGRRKKL